MKLTDEMVDRAFHSLARNGATASIADSRAALEAALADVPEPGPVAVQNFIKGKLESERADRAEAKLEKVRKCIDDYAEYAKHITGDMHPQEEVEDVLKDLRAVLDGKP